MSVRSGRTSPEPFAIFDRDSCSWRTSRQSLPLENLPALPVTWPRSGTWDLSAAYELPTSEPRTGGSGSSSSPALLGTPRCSDGMKHPLRRNVVNARGRLEDQVSLLSTPRASDGEKGGPNQRGSSGDLMLPSAVMLLPTPITSDWKTGTATNTEAQLRSAVHLMSTGPGTSPPSSGGNEPPDDEPQPRLF